MSISTPVSQPVAPALAALAASLSGTVASPGEPGYERAIPWNVAVPVAPTAVVNVVTAEDVATAVAFAGEHGLRVAVQRTGHGATELEGDDVLLVQTAALDEVAVDPETATARVGGGVLWQQVIDAAAPFGLTPLCGSTPHVSVAGLVTGGGIGPLSRTFGLASDHVRAFEVVTGDGQLLRATPNEHPELFWGLRGGKSTLGIVCAVELDLLKLDELYGGAIYFDGESAGAVLRAFQAWAPGLPEHVGTSVALLQLPPLPTVPPPLAGRLTVALRFTSTADRATAEALLAPIRGVAPAMIDTVGPLRASALGSVHADPVDPMPVHEASGLLAELTPAGVEALLAAAGPGSGSPQLVVELRLLGGAMGRPGPHADAFCHRDAAFALTVIGALVPPIIDVVPPHAAAVVEAVSAWATGGLLPNFAPASEGRIERAYDEPTRTWLAALADQYDPRGVLRVGQAVRAA